MAESVRRSGATRRSKYIKVPIERRDGADRRESMRDPAEVITSMKKIPTFHGLTDEQYNKILSICSKRLIACDQHLVREGDKSSELFILLKGQLKVVSKGGALLAYINTLGMVGEMGVFTDTIRSASVIAMDDSVVLRVSKKELYELFNKNFGMGNRILLNVIKDLTHKLNEDNDVIEELRKRRSTLI